MKQAATFLCLLALARTAPAASIVVDIAGGGDFTDIQAALDAASSGDTVLVKRGEYVVSEPVDFNRLHDPAVPESPPVKDLRLVSEGGPGETTIRMSTDPKDPQRTSVVIFESGETPASALEGFRLTGGRGSAVFCSGDCALFGGGILLAGGSSPTITGCAIAENSATWGGGMYALSSSPAVLDCTIARNWASLGIGGVYLRDGAAASFARTAIEENAPGGVYCLHASPTFSDCRISKNLGGSGFQSEGQRCAPVLVHCTISSNSSIPACAEDPCPSGGYGGGLLFDDLSTPTLKGCIISLNAAFRGGAFLGRDQATLTLVNCAVWGNLTQEGGCIRAFSADLEAMNCTLAQNFTAAPDGEPSDGTHGLTNCIVWQGGLDGLSVTTSHCLIDRDPLFVLAGTLIFDRFSTATVGSYECLIPEFLSEMPDHRLQPGSPAIDQGASENAPALDLLDQARPCGGGVDIGAYEAGGCFPRRFIRADADATGSLDLNDVVYFLNFQFLGGPAPGCMDAADVDENGSLDITDAVASLSFQFLGGPPPATPFPVCGFEEWIDGLDCLEYTGCRAGA